eukprot:2418234-Lingulodinium_polyedra.AAC.1
MPGRWWPESIMTLSHRTWPLRTCSLERRLKGRSPPRRSVRWRACCRTWKEHVPELDVETTTPTS